MRDHHRQDIKELRHPRVQVIPLVGRELHLADTLLNRQKLTLHPAKMNAHLLLGPQLAPLTHGNHFAASSANKRNVKTFGPSNASAFKNRTESLMT